MQKSRALQVCCAICASCRISVGLRQQEWSKLKSCPRAKFASIAAAHGGRVSEPALEARPGMRHHTVRYGEAVARRVASSPVAAEVDGSPIIGTLSFQPQNCSKRKFANEKEMNRYIT